MDDAKFMFNIANFLMGSRASSGMLLYEILTEVTYRMDEDFDSSNPHIKVRQNQNDAVRTCLEGQYGIFNNLPSPNVHNVGGHVCMKIDDVIV